MLLFLWQIFPVSFGQKSNTAFEILLLARDCFGRAVWVRRITRRRTPANRRKSPSMPRCRMRNGFSFDRIKVEDISSAMSIPTTVDLEHKITRCLLNSNAILQVPDVDRYAFCGQQAGDDAESKAVANVGEDDHGHGDEVEVGDQLEREETGMAESRKDSNREEGEADYDRCGEEDSLPGKNCHSKDFHSENFLTGCTCEGSRRSRWHRRFLSDWKERRRANEIHKNHLPGDPGCVSR